MEITNDAMRKFAGAVLALAVALSFTVVASSASASMLEPRSENDSSEQMNNDEMVEDAEEVTLSGIDNNSTDDSYTVEINGEEVMVSADENDGSDSVVELLAERINDIEGVSAEADTSNDVVRVMRSGGTGRLLDVRVMSTNDEFTIEVEESSNDGSDSEVDSEDEITDAELRAMLSEARTAAMRLLEAVRANYPQFPNTGDGSVK